MLTSEFSAMSAKEVNKVYNVNEKEVIITKTGREDKPRGAKTLYSGNVDCEPFTNLNITQLCRFIETGKLPKKRNESGAAEPRTISDKQKGNFTKLSAFYDFADERNANNIVKEYKDCLKKVRELEAKYRLSPKADDVFNVFSVLVFDKVLQNKRNHIIEVCERYKAIRATKLQTLENEYKNAETIRDTFCGTHWREMGKAETRKKAEKLSEDADKAKAAYFALLDRVYLTDDEIKIRLGYI